MIFKNYHQELVNNISVYEYISICLPKLDRKPTGRLLSGRGLRPWSACPVSGSRQPLVSPSQPWSAVHRGRWRLRTRWWYSNAGLPSVPKYKRIEHISITTIVRVFLKYLKTRPNDTSYDDMPKARTQDSHPPWCIIF